MSVRRPINPPSERWRDNVEGLFRQGPSSRASHGLALREQFACGTWSAASAKVATALLKGVRDNSKAVGRALALALTADVLYARHTQGMASGFSLPSKDAKRTYDAVVAELPTIRALVDDKSANVRAAAAMLLALLEKGAAESLDVLSAAATKERTMMTKAAQTLSAGYLAAAARKALPSWASLHEAGALLAGIRELAVALASDAGLEDESLPILVDFVRLGELPVDSFPWGYGLPFVVLASWARGNERRVPVAALALAEAAAALDANVTFADDWARAALDLAFPRRDEDIAWPDELAVHQRAIVERLTQRDCRAGFRAYGLTERQEDRRRWLGLAKAGPLERRVEVMVAGKKVSWPLWRWLIELQDDEPFRELWPKIRKRLPPIDALGVAAGMFESAYGLVPPPVEELFAAIDQTLAEDAFEWGSAQARDLLARRATDVRFPPALATAALYAMTRKPRVKLGKKLAVLVNGEGPPEAVRRVARMAGVEIPKEAPKEDDFSWYDDS
jgi:hypothetical protein